jgi:hypothetical protein
MSEDDLDVSVAALRGEGALVEAPLVGYDAQKKMTTESLLSDIEKRLSLALHFLDEATLRDASVKQLSDLVKVMFDRRQLLMGEPTQIVSNDDRRTINKLLPIILEQARMRGISVPVIEGEIIDG